MYHIFPCEKCRLKLNSQDIENNLNLVTINTIKKWYLKLNIKSLHQ